MLLTILHLEVKGTSPNMGNRAFLAMAPLKYAIYELISAETFVGRDFNIHSTK